jgi:hypothetical protein
MARIEGICREVCNATEFVAIVTAGKIADAVRVKFPWARGALVVRVEQTSTQL